MDAARRLALGQWFTPPAVVDLTLSLALPRGLPAAASRGVGEAAGGLRVLDPACGDGAFLAMARARGVTGLHGIEIDGAVAAAARARVPGARIIEGDLFDIAPDAQGGFDAVVGNPPYVRQERLAAAQKQRIRRCLQRDWPEVPAATLARVIGRGDLAAACILRALRLARPGARVALVVSSALLDAAYATALWQMIAGRARVLALVDAPGERWFADAAVNAMILLMERHGERHGERPGPAESAPGVQMVRLTVPTAQAAERVRAHASSSMMLQGMQGALAALAGAAEVHLAPPARPERWAAYLRASPVWFAFEQQAGEALVPLSAVAEVRRGVTSGANDIFYLPRARAGALGLEPALLLPLLRSPRDHATIAVAPEASSHVVLVCPPELAALDRHPAVRRYLDEHGHAAARPALRARRPWWALPVRPARLFLTKAYAARFVQHLAGAPMVADQRVYAVYPAPGIDVVLLAAVLNSTFTAFALESLGRSSMGEGALEWTVADAAHLPILDPRRLHTAGAADAARQALLACAGRRMGTVRQERGAADRARLDRCVALAAGGSGAGVGAGADAGAGVEGDAGPGADMGARIGAMLPAIWQALVESVQRRLDRARRT